jgi:hypothetical protein
MKNRGKLFGVFCIILAFLTAAASVKAQQTATATATLTGSFVTSINVTFGGSGYSFPPGVTITGGGGAGAGAYATISGGVVTFITVTNAGSGYTSLPSVAIQPPSTTPFASNLVLDLPMDGSVVDVGPNHFAITANGGGAFVSDRFGFANAAYSLNGVNQYITVPFNALLYPTQMTLSAWVKLNQAQSTVSTLWCAGNATSDGWRGYGLDLEPNEFNYQDFTGSGYNASVAINITNLQGWCQIAITRTANTASLFVNGVKINSATGLTSYARPQVAAMNIGADNGYGTVFNFTKVTFDSLHIYNRALSDAEVQTLYTTESINTNQPPALGFVVKTLRLNMSQLVPNYVYQLQSSPDLVTWTNVGSSFTATNTSTYQDFDVINTSLGNFRILKL